MIWCNNSTLRYLRTYMKAYVHTKICLRTFMVALFVIVQNGKQCPPTGDHIDRMWHIHAMEHYSARKWNKLLTHAMSCTNLKSIVEEVKTWETSYWMMLFIRTVQRKQIYTDRKQISSFLGLRDNYKWAWEILWWWKCSKIYLWRRLYRSVKLLKITDCIFGMGEFYDI